MGTSYHFETREQPIVSNLDGASSDKLAGARRVQLIYASRILYYPRKPKKQVVYLQLRNSANQPQRSLNLQSWKSSIPGAFARLHHDSYPQFRPAWPECTNPYTFRSQLSHVIFPGTVLIDSNIRKCKLHTTRKKISELDDCQNVDTGRSRIKAGFFPVRWRTRLRT